MLYCTLLAAQLIVLIDSYSTLGLGEILAICVILTGFCGLAVILCMPMRHPRLSNDEISPVFGPPTARLRTPEDNLTLWQFLTISWMSPLISRGVARPLNDEDVWSLGYEFQHRMLHDRFRELQGSVLSRLLTANGKDCIITASLGIVELLASTQSLPTNSLRLDH